MDLKLQKECRDEIKEGMAMGYSNGKLNTDFLKDVVDKFGQEMVEVTIAKSIPQIDGRISIPNRDWAKDVINNSNDDLSFAVGINEHAGLLNVLANRYADFKEQLAVENENAQTVGNFYKIAETYQIGDSEIGYGASDSEIGKTYGTWECIPSLTEEKGEKDWFYGHYFDNENDAREDFKSRIADKEDLMCIKEENKYVNKENSKESEKGFSLASMKELKKGLETKETKPPTNNREER